MCSSNRRGNNDSAALLSRIEFVNKYFYDVGRVNRIHSYLIRNIRVSDIFESADLGKPSVSKDHRNIELLDLLVNVFTVFFDLAPLGKVKLDGLNLNFRVSCGQFVLNFVEFVL